MKIRRFSLQTKLIECCKIRYLDINPFLSYTNDKNLKNFKYKVVKIKTHLIHKIRTY